MGAFSSARALVPVFVTCLVLSACAGSIEDVQDARDAETDPFGSLVRWIPEDADLLLFVDRSALARARLPDFLDSLELETLIGGTVPASIALGASVERLVTSDINASGRFALVFPDDGTLDAGETFERHGESLRRHDHGGYRVRLPDGHFGIVPTEWGEDLAHVRAIAQGSPSDALRTSMPTTGDPVVAAFAFVLHARVRELISNIAPDHREDLRTVLATIPSVVVIVQASAERFTVTIDVNATTPDTGMIFQQVLREYGPALRGKLFEVVPGLARHRAIFENAPVRLYGATVRSRFTVEHRTTLNDILSLFATSDEAAPSLGAAP